MLGEENLHMGQTSPESLGGSSAGVMLYVPDVDKAFARAVAAGAKAEAPPMDMFWGDRYCKFVDPFGHKWSMATHIKDLTPRQMQKATDAFMAEQMAQGAAKP
jgi:PhnB protein